MHYHMRICGIDISLETDDLYQFNTENYTPFFIEDNKQPDMNVSINTCSKGLLIPQSPLQINRMYFSFENEKNEILNWDGLSVNSRGNICRYWSSSSSDWSEVRIGSLDFHVEEPIESNLLITAVHSRVTCFSGFLMHGSIVAHDGKAVVFTASSGGGKSTQAALWSHVFGDRIINGDKAFLRMTDNTVYAYGSPWSGSSPYKFNEQLPLSAIVILEKADNNSIKKLGISEALVLCGVHCYYPVWEKELMELSLDTFNAILSRTPVYLLKCRPDEEAAHLACDSIFGLK